MDLKAVRKLCQLLREYDLSELEMEREGERLRVRREMAVARPVTAPASGAAIEPTGAAPASRQPRVDLLAVEAPMVGTFYRGSSPDVQPYVREGDVVQKGQVVCIIEAMKLMNEIESKVSGRVAKVLVENAQPVEYGQPLFLLEP